MGGKSARAEMVRLSVGPLETNCYLVADVVSGKAAVIDPGDETWRIQHSLAMHEWALVWVLVTHAHFDHIAAAGELAEQAGCPIALHPADLPLWWMHGAADLMGIKIPDLPKPQHTLTEGETIPVGDLKFEVLHLPGHSPGHVGFFLKPQGWLFSGDVIFAEGGVGRSDLMGGDESILAASVETVLRLPEATEIFPGHGGKTTVGAERTLRMI
jgi:glyoxylase-like metal-dependent hydrolase (beta-lactamase superfamily II)